MSYTISKNQFKTQKHVYIVQTSVSGTSVFTHEITARRQTSLRHNTVSHKEKNEFSEQTNTLGMSNTLTQNDFADGITNPGINDILCGRGKSIMGHAGNQYYHYLIQTHKQTYTVCNKESKKCLATSISEKICSLNPPGRFLKYDIKTGCWHEIEHKQSLAKIRQALREGAPGSLKEIRTKETESQGIENGEESVKCSSDHLEEQELSDEETEHIQNEMDFLSNQSTGTTLLPTYSATKQKVGDKESEKGPLGKMNADTLCGQAQKRCTSGDQFRQQKKPRMTRLKNVSEGTDSTTFLSSMSEHVGQSEITSHSSLTFRESDADSFHQSKQTAFTRAKEGNWKECQRILEQIFEYQRKMHFDNTGNITLLDLADTVYHLGVAQNHVGNINLALEAFNETLNLRQHDPRDNDVKAVLAILQIARIKQKQCSKDVETEIYDLMLTQLNKESISCQANRNVSIILKQFERALDNVGKIK